MIQWIVIVLVVAFLLFYLVNQPESAGHIVGVIWDLIVKIVTALFVFFQTLTTA